MTAASYHLCFRVREAPTKTYGLYRWHYRTLGNHWMIRKSGSREVLQKFLQQHNYVVEWQITHDHWFTALWEYRLVEQPQ